MIPSIGKGLHVGVSELSTLAKGSEVSFYYHASISVSGVVCRLTDTKFAVAYKNPDDNYTYAIVGEVSNGDVITYGTPRKVVSSLTNVNDITRLSDTSFVIVMTRSLNNTTNIEAMSVSGTTLSLIRSMQVAGGQSNQSSPSSRITGLSSTTFAIIYTYTYSGINDTRIVVCTTSGSIGTNIIVDPDAENYKDIVGLSSTSFAYVCYNVVVACTVSGTTITKGSNVSIGTRSILSKIDSTRFLSTQELGSNTVRVGTVSGLTLVLGTSNSIDMTGAPGCYCAYTEMFNDEDMLIMAYDPTDETSVCIGHLNGSIITQESWFEAIPATIGAWFNNMAILSSNQAIVVGATNDNRDGGTSVIITAS